MTLRAALFSVIMMILPGLAAAQTTSTGPNNPLTRCVRLGATVTFTGNFSRVEEGQIVIDARPRARAMQILSWRSNRVRARVPTQGINPGGRYLVQWIQNNQVRGTMGLISICRTTAERDDAPNTTAPTGPRERAARDEIPAPDGSPEYVVSVPSGQANAASAALQGAGATLLRTRALPNLGRTLLILQLPPGLGQEGAQDVLDGAAPAARIDTHMVYGYAQGTRTFAPQLIGDPAGASCRLGRGVRVGIIDGPVDAGALGGASVTTHTTLINGERGVPANHGTAVAALVAAPSGGFAPGARLLAVNAFSRETRGEGGRLENIAAGLDWLAGQGAEVVNMSFAGRTNAAFGEVLGGASRQGMVLIAAVGNTGRMTNAYPAAAGPVIAVTAVDAASRLYRSASTGGHVELAAPGVDVFAAGAFRTGTSFAAPIVTALAARLKARGSGAGAIRGQLRQGVIDLGASGRDAQFGFGLVRSPGC